MKYLTILLIIFNILSIHAIEYKIPFELVHNNIIITSKINDVNCKLMFDTGARSFTLDSIFASKNGLTAKDAYKGKITGEFGEITKTIKYLQIGNWKKIGGSLYDGLIGIDFFKDFIIKIDYEEKHLILSSSLDNKADLIELNTKTFLKYLDNRFIVEGNIELSDGKVLNGFFLFDTGSGRSISLTNRFSKIALKDKTIKKAFSKGINNSVLGFNNSTYIKVKSFSTGNIKLKHYIVDCNVDVQEETSQIIDGIIGGAFLKNFIFYIDYKNSKVYLRNNHDQISINPNDFYSDGFQVKDYRELNKGVVVSSVLKGENNNKIKVGDEILEVSQIPIDKYNLMQLEREKRELGNKITYKLKRRNKIFTIITEVKRIL